MSAPFEHDPIPLAKPDLGRREIELVTEVIRSGRLSLGPKLDEFERSFAGWLGSTDAVAVSSGTAALHLGTRALGWQSGDEVVTTPFSFVASTNCLLYEGVAPVFCDIDPVTLNIDSVAAEAAVGERTVGLLPVHIFGYPAAIGELEGVAEKHGLGVLEDGCQAIGAEDADGRRVGARGNPTAFAFYANKVMTTGEGGILVPASEKIAELARSERNQGRSAEMAEIDHLRIGFNYRLTEISAALGLAQLERLDQMLAARAQVAALYRDGLSELGGAPAGDGDADDLVLPCADRGSERRSWFTYCVRLPTGSDRAEVIAELGRAGIAAKAYLPCIHLMPPYRERFGYSDGEFPVAEEVAARSLALPFFATMQVEQVDRVCSAFRLILGRR